MSSFVARYTSFLFAPYILAFDVLWGHLLGHLLIRRGGYSWKFLVGVCHPVLQILTLFQTSDLASKIHIRFQTWRRSQNAKCIFTKTEIISSLLRLERQQKDFSIIHFEFTLYGFISHSFGTNRQIC